MSSLLRIFPVLLLLPIAASAQTFTEVSGSAGIMHRGYCQSEMTGGVLWFDYDADGDDDLYTTGGLLDNQLYRNNGDGTFTDVTAAAGLSLPAGTHTQGVAAGDIDNDGYRELYVATWFTQPNFFFKNNGDGTFSDISVSSGLCTDTLWTSAISFEDFNQDGLLDLYCLNYVYSPVAIMDSTNTIPVGYAHRCDGNSLYINNGDLTFTDMAAAYAVGDTGCGLAAVVSDFDLDNDRDILIANDFGDWITPNVMYRNNWPATAFSDISTPAGMDHAMYGMGIAAGDPDHDLDFDYYYTDIGGNAFYRNNGDGTFTDIAPGNGTINDSIGTPSEARTSWGTAFMDIDNDTWQDLYVANGYIRLLPSLLNTTRDPDALYRNLGNGNFSDISSSAGIDDTTASRGMAYADYDHDGDLDVFVNVIRLDTTLPHYSRLYRNDQQGNNHWVQFTLEGVTSNRDAFGTRAIISAGGLKQAAEMLSGSSHMSQNTSTLHYGLGAATMVDSLWLIWPDGSVQLETNFAADSLYHIIQDSSRFLSRPRAASSKLALKIWPQPANAELSIRLSLHQADDIRMEVLDLAGKVVQTEHLGILQPGSHLHTWDLRDASTRPAAGLYLLRIQGQRHSASRRIILSH